MVYDRNAYQKYILKIKSNPELYEKWKEKGRQRQKRYRGSGLFLQRERERSTAWREKQKRLNPNFQKSENFRANLRRIKHRRECIGYYSNQLFKCNCCGENEYMFLEIDHLNDNGNKHRRNIGQDNIESWLIKNNFPDGFQILCCNCNKGKWLNKGICPHNNNI